MEGLAELHHQLNLFTGTEMLQPTFTYDILKNLTVNCHSILAISLELPSAHSSHQQVLIQLGGLIYHTEKPHLPAHSLLKILSMKCWTILGNIK
jgi:hypothetical protein